MALDEEEEQAMALEFPDLIDVGLGHCQEACRAWTRAAGKVMLDPLQTSPARTVRLNMQRSGLNHALHLTSALTCVPPWAHHRTASRPWRRGRLCTHWCSWWACSPSLSHTWSLKMRPPSLLR